MERTKLSRRISLIIRFLSTRRSTQHPTIHDIVDYVNEHSEAGEIVVQRTVDRAIAAIRRQGIRIDSKMINGRYVYILDKSNELPLIDEEDKQDFGVLLRLINTHDELKSVQWLKSMLISDYGMREDHFKNDEYFVLPKPNIRNHDRLLAVSMELVRYAKAETVVQFYYQPSSTGRDNSLKTAAPLQLRYYNGRYYLAAVNWKEDHGFDRHLTIYGVDAIIGLEVAPAPIESEDSTSISEEFMTFKHRDLSTQVGLRDYFKHCIGIYRPSDQSPSRVRLSFTDWARAIVRNQPLHHTQQIESDGDELIVSLDVYDTFELEFVLGSFRRNCKRLDRKG